MNKKSPTSIIATIISILLLISGTVGLILLQKPLQEKSQDVRSDASVDNGQVTVSSSPTSGSSVEIGDTTVDIKADTQGIQTDGIQLVFNIVTNTLSEVPTLSVPASSGLQNIYSNIEQTSDGYLVSVIATPSQIGQTFSANSPTTVLQLMMKAASAGNIEINFDREKSKSIVHATVPPQDTLTHVAAINYTVNDNSNTDPSPDPTPEASPDPSPSPDPTDDPGTGGVVVQGCNDSCSSNAECETNHRCYNGQCRLVTNVSSTTCQEQTDQGLDFGCNHYCADSNECDDKYSCLENKCRRADNPDDEYCRVPSSTIQAGVDADCNTACSVNADCAANLRCYYGACRLATNVSSTTCAAATTRTVSKLYEKDETAPKGGDIDSQEDEASDSTVPAAIIDKPSPSPSADSMMYDEEETALDAIVNSMNQAGVPINLLPIIALAAGGLLLLLVVIPKLLSDKNKPTKTTPVQQSINQEADKYERELQAKLEELKKEPTPPTTMAKPGVPTPPMTSTKPSTPPQSTMMERVKEKGVTTPKS